MQKWLNLYFIVSWILLGYNKLQYLLTGDITVYDRLEYNDLILPFKSIIILLDCTFQDMKVIVNYNNSTESLFRMQSFGSSCLLSNANTFKITISRPRYIITWKSKRIKVWHDSTYKI